jgi:hypothetical protein
MKIANRNNIIILAPVSDGQESTRESRSAGLPEVIAIHGEMWPENNVLINPLKILGPTTSQCLEKIYCHIGRRV